MVILGLQKLLVLSKNQQQLITNSSMVLNQNSIRIYFLFEKRND